MEALIPYALVILLILVVQMVIIRWIFRIDTQIRLLTEIRDELKQLNTRDKGEVK